MQSVLSRIWTRVNVSISSDDNYYTTGSSTSNYYDQLTKSAFIALIAFWETVQACPQLFVGIKKMLRQQSRFYNLSPFLARLMLKQKNIPSNLMEVTTTKKESQIFISVSVPSK